MSSMSIEINEGRSGFRRDLYFCILCALQLLNYIDRFGLATLLTDVQHYYNVQDTSGGMLMTAFLISATVSSPLFGYLGERCRRKSIVQWTVLLRILSVFASSYVPPEHFNLFVLCRALLGCGNCAFTVIAPLILADIFEPEVRSRKYAIFFLMTPMGSGLGHIIGSKTTVLFSEWQWGLRWSPIFGSVLLLLLMIFGYEQRDSSTNLDAESEGEKIRFSKRILTLLRNPTFIFLTTATTMVVAILGVFAFWLPSTMTHAHASNLNKTETNELLSDEKDSINSTFGCIYMFGGIIGVIIGTTLGNMLKSGRLLCGRKIARGDPIVCALGTSIAMVAFSMMYYGKMEQRILTFAFISTGTVGLCMNWSINVDLLMSIVEPNSRSTAYSLQVFMESLLDCLGPIFVGWLSDSQRAQQKVETSQTQRDSLLGALLIPVIMIGFATIMYIATAITLPSAQRKLQEKVEMNKQVAIVKNPSITSSEV